MKTCISNSYFVKISVKNGLNDHLWLKYLLVKCLFEIVTLS